MSDATAFHEAGHAVAMIAVGIPFHYVTIESDEEFFGRVHVGYHPMFLNVGRRVYARDLRAYITSLYAGPIAETKFSSQPAGGDDEAQAGYLLYQMYGPRAETHGGALRAQARRLVTAHWQDIVCIAQALLRERDLQFARVEQLLTPGPAAVIGPTQRLKVRP